MELLPISKSEAARYMGVKGEPDEAVMELLDRAERLVREKVRPKYVYLETDVSFTDEGVVLGAMSEPLTGEDIKRHLTGCNRAVMLAATLSQEADKLIRQAAVTNMAESLAIDCICSAAIEQVCDRAEQEIFAEHPAPYRTWRFSVSLNVSMEMGDGACSLIVVTRLRTDLMLFDSNLAALTRRASCTFSRLESSMMQPWCMIRPPLAY